MFYAVLLDILSFQKNLCFQNLAQASATPGKYWLLCFFKLCSVSVGLSCNLIQALLWILTWANLENVPARPSGTLVPCRTNGLYYSVRSLSTVNMSNYVTVASSFLLYNVIWVIYFDLLKFVTIDLIMRNFSKEVIYFLQSLCSLFLNWLHLQMKSFSLISLIL